MKLLIVTSDYPPEIGGMAEYSAAWAHALAGNGFDVVVLAQSQESFQTAAADFPNITVRRVKWSLGSRTRFFWAYSSLVKEVRRRKPDLILAHTWVGWGPALAYLKGRTGIPFILSAHGAEIVGPATSAYYRPLLRLSLKAADRVFPVSNYTADRTAELGIARQRIQVVCNGVDTDRFSPGTPDDDLIAKYGLSGKRTIVTVGGLVDRKGQDIVIRAVGRLRDRYPNLRYLVVGGWKLNSSREQYLKDLAQSEGVGDRVIFTGFVNQDILPEHYRLGEIFVMTGREVPDKGWVEGFGISYLEAAATGLPVIATLTGGTRDALSDQASIIVPPEDPIQTADAIAKLLDDNAMRNRMGAAAREWASENSWEAQIKRAIDTI